MKTVASLVIVLIAFGVQRTTSQSLLDEMPHKWGQSVDGLRIGIAAGSKAPSSGAKFNIALQNTGHSDFVVNLGMMLANGKAMFPSAVRLALTDPAGNSHDLKIGPIRVAGRVDDFMVAMPVGATYAFAVSLDQYSGEATREFGFLKLTPGRHQISASFDGNGAMAGNVDMKGVALLNFWKGTVRSSVVEFELTP
jgi:hypothetical protein